MQLSMYRDVKSHGFRKNLNTSDQIKTLIRCTVDDVDKYLKAIGDTSYENIIKTLKEKIIRYGNELATSLSEGYAEGQNSNSPSKEAERLENDFIEGIEKGKNENLGRLKEFGKEEAKAKLAGYQEGLSEIVNDNKTHVSSDVDVKSLEQINRQIDEQKQKLSELRTEREKNVIAFDEIRKLEQDYSKNIASYDGKRIYDSGQIISGTEALKEFNVESMKRNQFMQKYSDLIKLIQDNFIGQYSPAYLFDTSSIENFINSSRDLRQLQRLSVNGLGDFKLPEVKSLFQSVLRDLEQCITGVNQFISEGEVYSENVAGNIAKKYAENAANANRINEAETIAQQEILRLEEQRLQVEQQINKSKSSSQESLVSSGIDEIKKRNEYIKKSDEEIYASAMQLAKSREGILEEIAKREIDIANSVEGETKKIYAKMGFATNELFKKGASSYDIEEKIRNLDSLIIELQNRLSSEKDSKAIVSLNQQIDSARINLLALEKVYDKLVDKRSLKNGLYEFGWNNEEIIEKYNRSQRTNFSIGENNYNIPEHLKEYVEGVTKGIESEEQLTEAIEQRKQKLVELEDIASSLERKWSEMDNASKQLPYGKERDRAVDEAQSAFKISENARDDYNEVRQEYLTLLSLQENIGRSKENVAKVDITFLPSEWQKEEQILNRIDNEILAIIESKKKAQQPIGKQSSTSGLFQESSGQLSFVEGAEQVAQAHNKIQEEIKETNDAIQGQITLEEHLAELQKQQVNETPVSSESLPQDIEKESSELQNLVPEINKVKKALNEKTQAIIDEEKRMNSSVDNEVAKLGELASKITEIKDGITSIGDLEIPVTQNSATDSHSSSSKNFSSTQPAMPDEDIKAYIYAMDQAAEYERQEREYIKERNAALAEGARQAKKYQKEQEKINKTATNLQSANAMAKVNDYLSKNTKLSKEAKLQLEGYVAELRNGVTDVRLKDIVADFNAIRSATSAAGDAGLSFFDKWKKRAESFGLTFTTFTSFYKIFGAAKQVFNTVRELDTELVDVKKTFQGTNAELEQMYQNSASLAKQLGVTTKEIISQEAAWSRLGYSSKEQAETMAKLSSQFAAISPGMDVDTSTDGIVSSMKAFGFSVDEVQRRIMDNTNRIGKIILPKHMVTYGELLFS